MWGVKRGGNTIPLYTGLKETSSISANSAPPPPALWHPNWGKREILVTAWSGFTERPLFAGTVLGAGGGVTLTGADI